MSDTFFTLAYQVQAFLQQSKRKFILSETVEIVNRLFAQGSPKNTPSNSQKETRSTLRSQARGVPLYLEIYDTHPSHFKKAVDHLLVNILRFIQADPLLSAHFSPTQNLLETESVVGRRSISPINIMAATIEERLARILEAMKGIKDCTPWL